MLERAHANIDCWPLDQFSCKQLRCAVQRTYKGAKKALACAEATPTVENFHRFRTRAKRLWYELRILRPINPVVLKNLSDDLHSLGSLLGRAHDLSFLSDRLRSEDRQSAWEREGHKLLAVIEVSQEDLQRGAAELATGLRVQSCGDCHLANFGAFATSDRHDPAWRSERKH